MAGKDRPLHHGYSPPWHKKSTCMYVKAVGNKGVLDNKMPFWTFSQAGRAPTVLFTEQKF